MVIPAIGSIVIIPFPFSDLTASKLRPAVVLADAGKGDWILSQITSNAYADSGAVPLSAQDFARGGLRIASFARPGKLFTAHQRLFASEVGMLKPDSVGNISERVIAMLRTES